MAGDDYSSAISGGLKLKGGKPVGVTKKKKKDKSKDYKTGKDPKTLALEGALSSEEKDLVPGKKTEGEEKDDSKDMEEDSYRDSNGKTEAERKYEEMRKKRVCLFPLLFPTVIPESIRIAESLLLTNNSNSWKSASRKKA